MATTPEIQTARTQAQIAAEGAGTMAAGANTIGDVLKQKVLDAYNNNQDVIGQLDTATGTYLQSPQAGREKYKDVFDPFTREKLVSQYSGNAALPMLSLSSILGQRFGRIDDTIGAGTRAYSAATDAATNSAQLKRQLYEDLLKEYTTEESIRQAQESERLAREKFEFDKSKSGGTNDYLELFKLLGLNLGGGEQEDVWEDVTPQPEPWRTAYEESNKRLTGGDLDLSGIDWSKVNLGGMKSSARVI